MSYESPHSQPSSDDSSSDVLLGQLLQHYVEDMTNFQAEILSEDEYFNREEQCVERLECIKQTIEGDSEEIKICVNRAHTLIEFLHTSEDFPEKFQIGLITAGILCTQTLLKTVVADDSLLDFFFAFLDRTANEWDEVQASHWAQVASQLVKFNLPREYFAANQHKYLRKLVHHMDSPSVHEFLGFLVGIEEGSDRASLLPYYVVETDLVALMAEEMLKRTHDDNYQMNCCTTLVGLIKQFSSLPSFSARFQKILRPTVEALMDMATAPSTPSTMTHNLLSVLTELVAYDMRASKYAALCVSVSTPHAQSCEELPAFIAVAVNMMPRIHALIQSRSLVLWKTLELVRGIVATSFDTVLQSLEAHGVVEAAIDSLFSARSNEFARNTVMNMAKEILRGNNYRAKMLLLESSNCLSDLPQGYRNVAETRTRACLGQYAVVLTEVLGAASVDSDVGCVVDAHGEWGQVRARYSCVNAEEENLGLDAAEMIELFGADPQANGLVSPPRAPTRCFVSPVADVARSITPDSSVSPDKTEQDDICQSEPTNSLGSLQVSSEDLDGLRFQDCEEGDMEEEEDQETVMLVGMENVHLGSDSDSSPETAADDIQPMAYHPTGADRVHARTPMHKTRPAGMSLTDMAEVTGMNTEDNDKENQGESGEEPAHTGITPKKMVQLGDGYQAVSVSGDTPKPKVQARSRTYYSRAAKSKSPFASAEKTPKSRVGVAKQQSVEKLPAKKLDFFS